MSQQWEGMGMLGKGACVFTLAPETREVTGTH